MTQPSSSLRAMKLELNKGLIFDTRLQVKREHNLCRSKFPARSKYDVKTYKNVNETHFKIKNQFFDEY